MKTLCIEIMEKKNFIEFVERIENKGPVGKAFIQLLKTGWIVIKHLGLVFKSLYVLAKECYIWIAKARVKYLGPVVSLSVELFIFAMILFVTVMYYKSKIVILQDKMNVLGYEIEKKVEQQQLSRGIDMYMVGMHDGIDSMKREDARVKAIEEKKRARWLQKQKEQQQNNDSIRSNT